MTLEELRKARFLSLSLSLSLSRERERKSRKHSRPTSPPWLEKRGDMHASNLRRHIEALGGTLEITAHFDKTTVVISDVGEPTTTR